MVRHLPLTASQAPRPLALGSIVLLGVLAAGVTVWRLSMRQRPPLPGASKPGAGRHRPLTDVEWRALRRRLDAGGRMAPVASDIALADRFDRYAG